MSSKQERNGERRQFSAREVSQGMYDQKKKYESVVRGAKEFAWEMAYNIWETKKDSYLSFKVEAEEYKSLSKYSPFDFAIEVPIMRNLSYGGSVRMGIEVFPNYCPEKIVIFAYNKKSLGYKITLKKTGYIIDKFMMEAKGYGPMRDCDKIDEINESLKIEDNALLVALSTLQLINDHKDRLVAERYFPQ